MARFERSKGRRDSKRGPPRRDSRDSRDSGRGFNRDRRDVEMTRVTCSSCGEECEVPFKPTSNKPVYCDECFAKKDKSSGRNSNKSFDIINEKLDKIMKVLKIK